MHVPLVFNSPGQSLSREEVREALSCLNDNVRLAQVGLVRWFPQVREAAAVDERANRMRAILLDAIEVLRPPRRLPFGALESRHYDVLSMRYVEGMTVNQVARELSLGRRQIHRDLQQAEEKLAEVLSSWPGVTPEAEPVPGEDPLRTELQALASEPAAVELQEAVKSAIALVGPLAQRLDARVTWCAAVEQSSFVVADRAVLRQLLVLLLSTAIQSAPGAQIAVNIIAMEEDASSLAVAISLPADVRQLKADRLTEAQLIASSQGIGCELWAGAEGRSEIRLLLRRSKPVSVLVVEDNPSAVELYRRYLPPDAWEVQSVSDPRLAYKAASDLRPDVIILDIMMPKMDGWSVLSVLASHPKTADIPVLICSVVYDPELAEALGARAYLKKPLSESQLLAALNRILVGR